MSLRAIPIYPRSSLTDAIRRVVDAVCVLLALQLAVLSTSSLPTDFFWAAAAVGIALFYLVGEFCGMYRNWRGASAEKEILCSLITWGFTFLTLLAVGLVAGIRLERNTFLIWLLATPILISNSRLGIRTLQKWLRAHGLNTRKYAIVGVNELAFQLARNVSGLPELGLRLHGFFDDRPESRTPTVPQDVGQRVGNLDELVVAARSGEVDMIYLTFPMRAEQRIRNVLERLGDTTASVYLVPDFFVFELLHSRWTNIGGLPAVSVFEHPFYGIDGILKRIMDLVLGALALVLATIPMCVIAVLVKLTSPGPVFFRQRRYGLDGREILVWKFRSMRVCENGDRVVQAKKNDSRVTAVGAVLRTSSLDELPQLFNVLAGNMSLVGPRPHASAHNEEYRTMIQGYMLRHKVKPGITGLAQVSGWRGETDTLDKMERRIECDHRYIREWSLWLDVKILFRTIFVVFARQTNAY
jgi:putative colanic acid biosynthesis UDP-glucose lipid carrier transferase